MTVDELVKYLEDITDSEESPYRQAAAMLRKQQADVDKLRDQLIAACSKLMDMNLKAKK